MALADRVIDGARLVQIRPKDGAQLYVWGDASSDSMWICGRDRAANVRVGMTGRLIYRSTQKRGVCCFLPYGSNLFGAARGAH